MKLKNIQIVNAKTALTNLGAERLPIKVAYAVTKNFQKLDADIRTFESLRLDIFKRWGKENDQGMISILPEHQKEFETDMNDLLMLEIEVDILQVNLNNVDCKMSPLELLELEWMIVME